MVGISIDPKKRIGMRWRTLIVVFEEERPLAGVDGGNDRLGLDGKVGTFT